MAIDCPDNSTECLLRALITTTATQQSPWEPRSFGFTVAIGVAAFLISFVAIFQGLLAAGPGRIKASQNAIGTFGKLTEGRLSFVEFAWRSTAKVPLITYDGLREGLEKQSWFVPHGINYPFEAGSFSTGATWYHLLKCVGLHEEVETIYQGNLQQCPTDHLPADIQAPPVSIQLHCLAILAAMADPSVKLEKAGRFLNIVGRVSQLSFREHPVLGTLAAYECYQTKNTADNDYYLKGKWKEELEALKAAKAFSERPTVNFLDLVRMRLRKLLKSKHIEEGKRPNASIGRCTTFSLDLAQGKLGLTWAFNRHTPGKDKDESQDFMNASATGRRCSLARWHMPHGQMPLGTRGVYEPFARGIALMVARTDYEVRPFPWVLSGLSEAVDWLIEASRAFCEDPSTFKAHLEPSGCQVPSDGFSKRDVAKDKIFELSGSWIVPGDPMYDIGGDFDSHFSADLFKTCTNTIKEFRGELKVEEISDTTHFVMNYDERIIELWWYLKHIDILLRKKRFQAMDVLDALQRRLVDAYAAEAEARPQAAAAVSADHPSPQPPQSGSSAQAKPPANQSVGASATPRSSTSTAPSVGVRESLQLSAPSDAGSSHRTSHDTLPRHKPIVTEEECLECLLIIRGLLYAALLKAGPDTSMLWEPDFRNAIVKIM